MATAVAEHTYGDGTCAAPGCGMAIPLGHLMCRSHWGAVPRALRTEVWSALQRWTDGHTTLGELRRAQDAAIASLPSRAGHAAACSVHRGGSCDRLPGCLQEGS